MPFTSGSALSASICAKSSSFELFSGWILTSFGAHLWSPSGVRESADLFGQFFNDGFCDGVSVDELHGARKRQANRAWQLNFGKSTALLNQHPGDGRTGEIGERAGEHSFQTESGDF